MDLRFQEPGQTQIKHLTMYLGQHSGADPDVRENAISLLEDIAKVDHPGHTGRVHYRRNNAGELFIEWLGYPSCPNQKKAHMKAKRNPKQGQRRSLRL